MIVAAASLNTPTMKQPALAAVSSAVTPRKSPQSPAGQPSGRGPHPRRGNIRQLQTTSVRVDSPSKLGPIPEARKEERKSAPNSPRNILVSPPLIATPVMEGADEDAFDSTVGFSVGLSQYGSAQATETVYSFPGKLVDGVGIGVAVCCCCCCCCCVSSSPCMSACACQGHFQSNLKTILVLVPILLSCVIMLPRLL